MRLWDTATGAMQATLTGHTGQVNAVAFSPDGQRLASASSDQTVRLWDTATGTTQGLTGHTGQVNAVAFSPDGQRLAAASYYVELPSIGGAVRLWDMATGAVQAILTGHTERVNAVAFSSDGRWLASASNDQTVRLTDVNAGKTLRLLRVDASIHGLAWSRDAMAVAKGRRSSCSM